jgi:hypothetical protein
MTVMVLGLANFNLDESETSWSSLKELLTPLKSGVAITKVSQNFIDWSSAYSVTIAGHLSGMADQTNTERMIDVTDYHKKVINSGGSKLTFVLYRPFRHPEYITGAGPIEADDLSKGSLLRIASRGLESGPQLIQLIN